MNGSVAVVGLVMGSDSDWPVMEEAAKVLEEFGIDYEADVLSAHRMPQETLEYGQSAADRGLRVIIAGAGGAAALPGILAAVTPLPVIGVPVPLAQLDGLDSLLSIVQMPAGIPVAAVAIGGARNAGLLAVRILAAGSDDVAVGLRAKLVTFQSDLRDQALAKGERLRAPFAEAWSRRSDWKVTSLARSPTATSSEPAARIRTASRPALRAPPIATAATGIPAGICTIESNESRPSSWANGTGTPITGSGVSAASMPGRAAAPPAPAMITRSPRSAADRP